MHKYVYRCIAYKCNKYVNSLAYKCDKYIHRCIAYKCDKYVTSLAYKCDKYIYRRKTWVDSVTVF